MTNNVPSYDIATIRELLLAAFTANELHRFCQERTTLRPVVDRFGPNLGLDDMVDHVIEYCETRLLFDELLIEVKGVNPHQYARFEEHLQPSDDKPLFQKSDPKKSSRRDRLEKIAAIAAILALIVAVLTLGRDYFGWIAPTPASTCAVTALTDSDALLALIDAEEQAVLNEDIELIMTIFAPDAPIRNAATNQVWNSPKEYYTEKFHNEIHCQIDHHSFRVQKLTDVEAHVTTASRGKWGWEAEGCTQTYENQPESDQWYFHKDDLGCWRIVRFTYNVTP
jgi:ketosteroid isomerase-like protein